MLIATFGPTTAWLGRRITREGDICVLDGHGPITADEIMEYDRQGHLVWVNAGARAWVGSKTTAWQSRTDVASGASTDPQTTTPQDVTNRVGDPTPKRKTTRLKLALVLAIVVLVVTDVVLVLAVLGALRGP